MATSATDGLNSERRFYLGMALFMIVLVFVGFAPSFYLRGIVHVPRPNAPLTPLVVVHGAVFTLWMLTFATQAGLVAAGRRDLHMRLGMAGMALAVLLVPLMYVTAVAAVARATQPPFTTPLAWTAVPLFDIPVFAALLYLGWKHRWTPQAHKRLMLCAALVMMDPAIGRLPVPPSLLTHAMLSMFAWSTMIPLILHDRRTIGRLHWATRTGASLFAAALTLKFFALVSPFWPEFAAHLPGV